MKFTVLLIAILFFVPLIGCAEERAPVTSKVNEAKVSTSGTESEYSSSNGPRLCSSKRYGENARCNRINAAIPFRKYAEYLAGKVNMDVGEFIEYNEWTSFVDHLKTDPEKIYLYLLPEGVSEKSDELVES